MTNITDPDQLAISIHIYLMANSAEQDQLASSEANWSGSALFAQTGYIRIQQGKG